MKIQLEVDITPAEVKELFEGNVELLQRSLIELWMRQMAQTKSPDKSMASFWQAMAEQSSAMFQEYQNAMSGGKAEGKK